MVLHTGSMPADFPEMADSDLVGRARSGDRKAAEYLLKKYRGLVEGKARAYFLAGADREDVVQEGMIGLYKAIRDYRMDKPAGFRAFAELCVTRQIITAVKSATRQKHLPLNKYVSLQSSSSDGESDGMLLDILPDACVVDPEKIILDADATESLKKRTNGDLSKFEKQVLRFYMQGISYEEMAKLLSCRIKSVDNALQRAKRKIGEKMARD
jgi:RNA polymerase sporulation-specific sigma factor